MTHRPRAAQHPAAVLFVSVVLLLSCEPAIQLSDFRAGVVTPPVPKVDFVLTSHTGDPFDFRRETDGYATLLFFGYTYCPDVCPMHMARIGAALKDIDQSVVDDLRVVFVSVDPERDTPDRLRTWLSAFHPSFIGLTGSTEDVNAVLRRLRFQQGVVEEGDGETYGVSHSAQVIGYTPDNVGRFFYLFGTRQEDFAHDIPLLVAFKGEG